MLSALGGPVVRAVPATPSDANTFSTSVGLYIGTGGNINIGWGIMQSGIAQPNTIFLNVIGGTILPVRANQVYATGTTANNIVILY